MTNPDFEFSLCVDLFDGLNELDQLVENLATLKHPDANLEGTQLSEDVRFFDMPLSSIL
jgi:hypothetical protein